MDELLRAFEAGEISPHDFPHERHVQVTWALVQRYEPEEAFARLAAGIRDIAARAGVPGKYHETITRAWFELVRQCPDLDAAEPLYDRGLLARYYSPARLAEGRDTWVEPDLRPLRP